MARPAELRADEPDHVPTHPSKGHQPLLVKDGSNRVGGDGHPFGAYRPRSPLTWRREAHPSTGKAHSFMLVHGRACSSGHVYARLRSFNVTAVQPSKKVWVQVADELRGRIADGTYPANGRFPSETDLVQEFGIARGTARKIAARLRDEGLIYTEPQVGSFVADHASGDVADKSGD